MTTDNSNKTTGGTIRIPITTGSISNVVTNSTMALGIQWHEPQRIEINEYIDSIEMIYRQEGIDYSKTYFTINPPFLPEHHTRVFKIVYSCIDGKWNKSEPIYGKIIPATKESYEFEE